MSTVDSLLQAGRDRDVAIAVPGGPTLTYAQLRAMVHEASSRLASLGVRPHDRVAMVFPNGPEAIVLFLAVASVATACPLNAAYKEAEFRFYLEDTGARFLLAPGGEGAEARRAMPQGSTVIEADIDDAGTLRLEIGGPHPALPRERGREIDSLPTRGREIVDGEAVALVLHTSGTTSRPKRVPLRHRNLVASVANIVETYRLGPEDVSLCVMPLFHVHGLVASALATLASGGTVAVPRRFTPMMFWPIARQVKPTWFTASPTPHQLILMRTEEKRAPGTERLRFVRSCSSALSPELMARMEDRFGAPVLEAYGMTEASHQMSSNPLPPERRIPGSVGRGTGVEIAILDEHGATLPSEVAGEVGIRGPNVIDGYENNPEANLASFTNGWFRTGDLGTLDDAGYLRLLGRIKELINRGGEKIAPREIDEALESHPAVKEAVSFGVPHPTWGEEVAAAVVLSEAVPEKDLIAHCRTRLADFKVPKRVHIVDSIPRTPTGKVQRRFVAEQLTSR
jgi:acyl-CoA synthetase (AMP-forming)/AMP-acid ligase II